VEKAELNEQLKMELTNERRVEITFCYKPSATSRHQLTNHGESSEPTRKVGAIDFVIGLSVFVGSMGLKKLGSA
jgi:hypothetical protein